VLAARPCVVRGLLVSLRGYPSVRLLVCYCAGTKAQEVSSSFGGAQSCAGHEQVIRATYPNLQRPWHIAAWPCPEFSKAAVSKASGKSPTLLGILMGVGSLGSYTLSSPGVSG